MVSSDFIGCQPHWFRAGQFKSMDVLINDINRFIDVGGYETQEPGPIALSKPRLQAIPANSSQHEEEEGEEEEEGDPASSLRPTPRISTLRQPSWPPPLSTASRASSSPPSCSPPPPSSPLSPCPPSPDEKHASIPLASPGSEPSTTLAPVALGQPADVYRDKSKDGVIRVDGGEKRKSVMTWDEAMVVDQDDAKDMGGDARPAPPNDGEKEMGIRASTRKRKTLPTSKREGGDSKPRLGSKGKSKPKPRTKKLAQSKSKAPSQDHEHTGMLNYFEEIEIDGGSRLVDIYDLTQAMVCLLFNTISALLNWPCRRSQPNRTSKRQEK